MHSISIFRRIFQEKKKMIKKKASGQFQSSVIIRHLSCSIWYLNHMYSIHMEGKEVAGRFQIANELQESTLEDSLAFHILIGNHMTFALR